jgi:hypothetical protein
MAVGAGVVNERQMTGRRIRPLPVAASAIGAAERQDLAGRRTGTRCNREKPTRGIRDLGNIRPPAT